MSLKLLQTLIKSYILGDPGVVSRGRAKWHDESFQERAKEPLGTKSHRTISKRLREYRLLIGQKKSLVLFCPIGEQQLSNHFRVFLHGDCCPAILVWFVHQGYQPRSQGFSLFSHPEGRTGGKRPWHRLVTCPSDTRKTWV